MIIGVLKFVGGLLYFIGALILLPAGVIIVTSVNTLMLAGPIVLVVLILGAVLAGIGKWMKNKAQKLEERLQ